MKLRTHQRLALEAVDGAWAAGRSRARALNARVCEETGPPPHRCGTRPPVCGGSPVDARVVVRRLGGARVRA